MIEARTEEAAAVTSRNDAVTARNDLATKNTELEQSQAVIVGKNTEIVKKNTELERSQDQLEGALARTWLSPLAEKPGPLNEVEIATLTQMSSPGNDRLAEHFLAEALGQPPGDAKAAGARAAFALHGVVGLDARKRQEAEGRLVRTLERPDLADESRIDVALTASALRGLSSPAAAVAAQTLLHALTRTNDAHALRYLAQGLSAAASRLEPEEADRVSAAAAATLVQAMAKTPVYFHSYQLWLIRILAAVLGNGRRPEHARRWPPRPAPSRTIRGCPAPWRCWNRGAFPAPTVRPGAGGLAQAAALRRPRARAILDHLEHRYQRPFADQWDFVRFAEEQKLGFDFTSPPKGR